MAKKTVKTYPYAVIHGGKLVPKNTPIEKKTEEEQKPLEEKKTPKSGEMPNDNDSAGGET